VFNAFSGVIQGRVQGVGFRYYAKAKAEELDLTGWVRNLPDGTVEVLAKGPVSSLERFMHCLEVGPIGSRVKKADFQWLQETQELMGFEIRG
jgi:acylphosphatase